MLAVQIIYSMDTESKMEPQGRKCRKCEEIIPNMIQIDGKTHLLRGRRFCLSCSPFGGGNRNKYDPATRAVRKYTETQKDRVKMCLYKKALRRRDEIYELKGGACKICGYNKCKRALCFHHRDPKTKLFGLGLNFLWSKSMKDILAEVDKCDLLCSNCHAEVEDEIARKTSIVSRINAKYGTNY